MVSIFPNSQATDMRQMYDFSDKRGKQEICYPQNSIMGIINSHPDFTLFSKIVKKARYDTILSEEQANFTVFVSSDTELRKKYDEKSFDNVDIGTAKQILKVSMMKRVIDKSLLVSSPSSVFPTLDRSNSIRINTVNGVTLISKFNNAIKIGIDCVKIIHFNQKCTNGIIHVIDDMLIPVESY